MRLSAIWILMAVAGVAALGLGGTAPFGRLALTVGLSETAAVLLDDPWWRGTALYRADRFEEAAEAFRIAGPRASYNRGNALARAGRYREAVEAYDAVLYRAPKDQAARANRALVAALVTETEGEIRAGGRILAAGPAGGAANDGREETATAAPARFTQQEMHQMVAHVFAGQTVIASRQWLTTLPDQPGRYLKLRLEAEHERRRRQGLAAPSGTDPW